LDENERKRDQREHADPAAICAASNSRKGRVDREIIAVLPAMKANRPLDIETCAELKPPSALQANPSSTMRVSGERLKAVPSWNVIPTRPLTPVSITLP
jgi:hypothetical protein